MESITKAKDWIRENVPMVSQIYENKYVGMAYDRFASLPPKQQKQILGGTVFGTIGIVGLYLLFSYIDLWSASGKAQKSYTMINMLLQYQKQQRDKSGQIQQLERNSQLAQPGAFKQHLLDQARNAGISARMVQAEEKPDGTGSGDEKGSSDVKIRQASVTLQRVNLSQLKSFMTSVEFGQHNLSVSSIKITNDDKIRGYMNVELGVVAYIFQSSGGGGADLSGGGG